MKNTATFTISYDGPALEQHEMDVKDLAPALLSLNELIEETNEVINKGETKIALNIKGSFKSGSFEVDLNLVQSVANQVVSFLSGDGVTAGLNLLQLIGFVGGGTSIGVSGLLGLLKWIKNRPIKSVIELGNGQCKITVTDPSLTKDDSITVHKTLIDLLQNLNIRNSVEKVITKPLEREGITTFSVKHDNGKEVITKEEKEYFKSPDYAEEILQEKEIETNLQIVSISFAEGHKWKFSDGNATFYATISDSAFLEKVKTNEESFAKDDILHVQLHQRQYLTGEGMKTDYDVRQVLNHRSAARQLKLPFAPKDPDF